MNNMMTTKEVFRIISSVVPLYVFIFIGYGSVKRWKIFNQEQCLGISRFYSFFAVPTLSFYYITKTNFYEMNLRFFGADVLQKVIVLLVLTCWYKLGSRGSIEQLITIFSICTLPNVLILGIRFINSMYYYTIATPFVVEIFLAQSMIWHPLLLFMYEYRAVRIAISQQFDDTHGHDVDIKTTITGSLGVVGGISCINTRAEEVEVTNVAVVSGNDGVNSDRHIHSEGHETSRARPSIGTEQGEIEEVTSTSTTEVVTKIENQYVSNRPFSIPSTSVMTKHIVTMVWKKLAVNPNTYATILGLVWAFVLSTFHIAMPLIVTDSVAFLSNASLGMGMFNMGLSMGLQPTLVSCSKVVATLTMGLRFIIGPMVMAFASLVVGLHGTIFSIAVVQAAISQGIAPTVFAVEYNVYPEIFSIGMTLGVVVVLPITLLYYNLLEIQG